MSSTSPQQTGAYAEFTDDHDARRAVQELEGKGVPRSHIIVSAHAPDQSGAPINTEERDKATVGSLWGLGWRGVVAGFIGGAIIGAALGSIVWSPMTPAWVLLALALAVFGSGIGLLWSFLIGQGEAEHMGTIYDQPAADQPTRITVRTDDPEAIDRLLETLEAAGGANIRRVPDSTDRPER